MQCPNCKFYKVDVDNHKYISRHEPAPKMADAIGIIVVGCIAWSVGNGILSNISSTFPEIAHKVLILKIILPVVCLIVCKVNVMKALKYSRPIWETDYSKYECRHCGYTWNDRQY